MKAAILALVALSILLCFWFTAGLGLPWRSRYPTGAWLWAAMAWVAIALDVLLMLVVLRVRFSPWVAVGVLAAQDGVYAWRLAVLYTARRSEKMGDPGGH